MAETRNPNEEFTGFRYLMDAETQRQYAVEFVLNADGESMPKLPVYVFNGEKLKPGETIYALDDEQQTSAKGAITTEAWKIIATEVDDKGQQHYDLPVTSVTYTVTQSTVGAVKRNTLDMNAESRAAILKDGLTGFPTRFYATPENTFLPPNHKGGKADVARREIAKIIAARDLKEDFNNPPKKKRVPKGPPKIPDIKIEETIRLYCQDLSLEAKSGRLDPVIGRNAEIDQSLKILSRRKQSSLCYTGDAGVGKSAMFYGVAQSIEEGKTMVDGKPLPASLKDARVILLDLQSMNAGSRYRGDFEEKIKPLIEGLAEREGILKCREIVNGREVIRERKIILAIDEIHSQLTAGAAEGGTNAGNMMKPFLTSKGISTMGTTTKTEYAKHIEKDPALASRFEQMNLESPDPESTLEILKGLWPLTREHNNLTKDMSNEDFQYIVTMTNRYAPAESQPRKGEKAMNMAASSAEFGGRTVINREDIIAAVAQMSKLSPEFLSQSDAQRFLELKTELPKEVIGQPGLSKIPRGLIGARSGLANPKQPWGCFVLQGPTGTGKTETCKALARHLFGDEKAIIRLDMSEYAEKHTVSRLIGAPPGYVGFDDAEPALTERIRQRPYSILLLDEIEKAHPDVFNVLLPVLEDGKMTDSHGKTVLFNNVIIVMTTNLGATKVQKLIESNGKSGLFDTDTQTPEKLQEEMAAIYAEAAKQANGGPFRPEMINRINALGGFITFVPLAEEVIAKIAVREISQINDRLGKTDGSDLPGATLEITPEIMKQICKEGYNPAMGARPLQTVVREKIINPFAEWIMLHKDEVRDFISKEGPTKIVISSLGVDEAGDPAVTPVLVKAANDNQPVKKKASAKKKLAAPHA